MDRLKQEWKETKIPEEALERARNLAWIKIQRTSGGRRALGWAVAASMAVVLAALVWVRGGREMKIEKVLTPARQIVSHPVIAENQLAKPIADMPQVHKTKPVKKHIASIQASGPAEEPEHIVLTLTLPESGARMIWIMDSSFHLDGGVE